MFWKFNKKMQEVSAELDKLREEVRRLSAITNDKNIMVVKIVKKERLEKADELGRIYEAIDGVEWLYDANRKHCIIDRDMTGRQFVEIIDNVTREIYRLRVLNDDEYITITKA